MEGQEQNPANSTANGPAQVGEMPLLTELESCFQGIGFYTHGAS